ncbi:MAG: hypothetical protein FJ125_01075 [Deltaproteobacteria bacterium]|nr:hypothetical protein [Deltaproteobacteria bacterium]
MGNRQPAGGAARERKEQRSRGIPSSTGALAALLVAALAPAPPAAAHPLDTYGFTSRATAMGSAQTAAPRRESAAHYNPGAVAGGERAELTLGLSHHAPSLRLNGSEFAVPPLLLWELGLATPLPLLPGLGRRLGFGAIVVLPQDGVYQLRQPDDRAVSFPLLDSDNRRLVLSWALGWEPLSWLQVGAGATLLPDVPGRVLLDIGDEGGVNSTEIDIEYSWSLIAGVLLRLPWSFRLGLSYRQGQELGIELPVEVEVTQGFAVAALVTGPAFFTPSMLAAGLAWQPRPELQLAFDLTWYGFSAYSIEAPSVTILDGRGRPLRQLPAEQSSFSDVLCPRGGLEWWPRPWLALRSGYGYHPTPVPPQQGRTNLLDGDRHVLALGLGVMLPRFGSWGPAEAALDLHGQLQLMEQVAWEKEEILVDNAGYPTVTGSGLVTSLGLALRVRP